MLYKVSSTVKIITEEGARLNFSLVGKIERDRGGGVNNLADDF